MSSTYTTTQGDTWDIIAKKLWGDEKLMNKLIQANPLIDRVFMFPAGIVLTVPEIETPVIKGPVPPWQK